MAVTVGPRVRVARARRRRRSGVDWRGVPGRAGVSAPTVTRSIQELEEVGLLKVISSPGPRANTYQLNWDDLTESAPAVVCALSMPLSFSIADGIGLGFITYVAVKLMSGRAADCSVAVCAVALIFLGKFAFL